MMNITLLAQSLGIYSIIMGGYDDVKVKEAFKIPKRYQISAVMALGYPLNLEQKMPTLRHPLGKERSGLVRNREDFIWRKVECSNVITFLFYTVDIMRGGKKGSHKGSFCTSLTISFIDSFNVSFRPCISNAKLYIASMPESERIN